MELEKLKELLTSKLLSLGYELVSLNLSKQKSENVLSLVVDRVEPIDMDAITKISEEISAYLDELDPLNFNYTLDISSLGAEKPIKVEAIKDYVNSYVHVHLINPIDGENIYEGTIKSVSNECFVLTIRIKTRVKDLVILFNNIYVIRLAIKF